MVRTGYEVFRRLCQAVRFTVIVSNAVVTDLRLGWHYRRGKLAGLARWARRRSPIFTSPGFKTMISGGCLCDCTFEAGVPFALLTADSAATTRAVGGVFGGMSGHPFRSAATTRAVSWPTININRRLVGF